MTPTADGGGVVEESDLEGGREEAEVKEEKEEMEEEEE
jgi:hypothetical protein